MIFPKASSRFLTFINVPLLQGERMHRTVGPENNNPDMGRHTQMVTLTSELKLLSILLNYCKIYQSNVSFLKVALIYLHYHDNLY